MLRRLLGVLLLIPCTLWFATGVFWAFASWVIGGEDACTRAMDAVTAPMQWWADTFV